MIQMVLYHKIWAQSDYLPKRVRRHNLLQPGYYNGSSLALALPDISRDGGLLIDPYNVIKTLLQTHLRCSLYGVGSDKVRS